MLRREEQLNNCKSSAREVKPVDKPSQIWTGKNPKRGKNLKTTAKQVGITYCSVQEKGDGLVCLLQTKPPQTGLRKSRQSISLFEIAITYTCLHMAG